MAVERIIGVDFGTSTSVIRVMNYTNGQTPGGTLDAKSVVFGEGASVVPTVIAKRQGADSQSYYGHEAQQKKRGFTIYSNFKMELESVNTQKAEEARELTEEFLGYMADAYKRQRDGGHFGSAEQERTIVSYPVKWKKETKEFMLRAAAKAGFPNVSGMDEATAAIHAVTAMNEDSLQQSKLLCGEPSNILLIDMGAGTTDLVLCRHTFGAKTETEILSTWPKRGRLLFGGSQVDTLLKEFFRDKMSEENAREIFRRVGTDKFKAWKDLSVSPALKENASVSDFEALDACVDMMGIELADYNLDRRSLEKYLEDYLRQLPMLVNGCLYDAGLQSDAVDLIITTGGHSQWYFVKEILSGKMMEFGHVDLPKIEEEPSRIVSIPRPQETVALGLVYSPMKKTLVVRKKATEEKTKSKNDAKSEIIAASNREKEQSGKRKNLWWVLAGAIFALIMVCTAFFDYYNDQQRKLERLERELAQMSEVSVLKDETNQKEQLQTIVTDQTDTPEGSSYEIELTEIVNLHEDYSYYSEELYASELEMILVEFAVYDSKNQWEDPIYYDVITPDGIKIYTTHYYTDAFSDYSGYIAPDVLVEHMSQWGDSGIIWTDNWKAGTTYQLILYQGKDTGNVEIARYEIEILEEPSTELVETIPENLPETAPEETDDYWGTAEDPGLEPQYEESDAIDSTDEAVLSTEPTDGSDILTATIEGEKQTFKLAYAYILGSDIHVTYESYNPRGELRYTIMFQFDQNLDEGTYYSRESSLKSDVVIRLYKGNSATDYISYRMKGGNDTTGTFVIETMSDDWTTYSGSFNAKLAILRKGTSITIEDAQFNFTLRQPTWMQ